ncbi:MAG TPA: glycoside hydrolase family 127 protein, partial [Chloroflexota bacterium]|nr:glycoside hydrolase family 127 protein [Chloroflexota bacterium]
TYAAVMRRWKAGDVLELDLPMPPRRVYSHPRVAANRGRVALARGPLVYCVEGADHPGVDLRDVVLPRNAALGEAPNGAPDGGVAIGAAAGVTPPGSDALYAHVPSTDRAAPAALTAIPYYAWANRDPGPMHVWLKETINGTET